MEENNNEKEIAQGAESTELKQKVAETLNNVTKRAISKSNAVKSLATTIKNLKGAGLITKEDEKKLKEVQEKIIKQYLGYEMGV